MPTEAFVTVMGLRSTSISINKETVDVTNKDSSNQWRELMAGAGVKSLSVSGSGVFTDKANGELVRGDAMGGAFNNYQVVVQLLGTFEGSFDVTSLEYAGEYNGEETYSVSLESAAEPTFTAEP